MLIPWKKSNDKPRQHIKKQRHQFADRGPSSQNSGFSSSHVWMWELDHKEGLSAEKLMLSNCGAGEDSCPLDCKIKAVNPKGNQPWIFIGRTVAEAEAPILWPPDAKSLLEKTLMLERLKAEGEEGNRGWDGWMALPTQWTWIWTNPGR